MTFQEAKKIMEQQLAYEDVEVRSEDKFSDEEWVEALRMAVVALQRVIP